MCAQPPGYLTLAPCLAPRNAVSWRELLSAPALVIAKSAGGVQFVAAVALREGQRLERAC